MALQPEHPPYAPAMLESSGEILVCVYRIHDALAAYETRRTDWPWEARLRDATTACVDVVDRVPDDPPSAFQRSHALVTRQAAQLRNCCLFLSGSIELGVAGRLEPTRLQQAIDVLREMADMNRRIQTTLQEDMARMREA